MVVVGSVRDHKSIRMWRGHERQNEVVIVRKGSDSKRPSPEGKPLVYGTL
jgi:hypothetical protein